MHPVTSSYVLFYVRSEPLWQSVAFIHMWEWKTTCSDVLQGRCARIARCNSQRCLWTTSTRNFPKFISVEFITVEPLEIELAGQDSFVNVASLNWPLQQKLPIPKNRWSLMLERDKGTFVKALDKLGISFSTVPTHNKNSEIKGCGCFGYTIW